MKTWRGCSGPDESSYNMLILGLARRGECRRAVGIAKEACAAAQAPQSNVRSLSEECLRSLFATLRRQGLTQELGSSLAEHLHAARMDVPEGAWSPGREGSAVAGTSREHRAAPKQSLMRPPNQGETKLEPAWMRARREARS